MLGFDEIRHGDRIIMPAPAGRWVQFRHKAGKRAVGRFHDSQEEAVRQATRLASREGGSVFALEPGGGDGFRLRRV